MMLYLTGATSSISQSSDAPQTDAMKSLGGYISSSPVPNASLNTLFDLVSMRTIKDKAKETIAVGLVNKFDFPVKNVTAKIVTNDDNVCDFKIAVVGVDSSYCIERIDNRYSEPLNAEFHDISFHRGGVDVEIIECAKIGEEISFEPFDVIVDNVKELSYDGTYNAISEAFNGSEYIVKRINEKRFRIEKDNDDVVESCSCNYLSTDKAKFKFLGNFENSINNEVLISESLNPEEAIGIWIQRSISNFVEKSDVDMIKDYNEKVNTETTEEVDLIINYEVE
jgi:hypothetical protein